MDFFGNRINTDTHTHTFTNTAIYYIENKRTNNSSGQFDLSVWFVFISGIVCQRTKWLFVCFCIRYEWMLLVCLFFLFRFCMLYCFFVTLSAHFVCFVIYVFYNNFVWHYSLISFKLQTPKNTILQVTCLTSKVLFCHIFEAFRLLPFLHRSIKSPIMYCIRWQIKFTIVHSGADCFKFIKW